MANLQNSVFSSLESKGHFYDPTQRQVEQVFMPWLYQLVGEKMSEVAISRRLVDEVLYTAVYNLVQQLQQKQRIEREKIEAEEKRIKEEEEAIERLKQEEELKKKQEIELAQAKAAQEEADEAKAASAEDKDKIVDNNESDDGTGDEEDSTNDDNASEDDV